MKSLLIVILCMPALAAYPKQPAVKKVTASEVYKERGKRKTHKQPEYYIVYNTLGHEMEYGTWGQSTCIYSKKNDSGGAVIISTGCTFDYSKISSADFSFYDTAGRKIKEESWGYKDNIKTNLYGYVLYSYNAKGHPAKESHYNDSNRIEKTTTYRYDSAGNNIEIIDSDFSQYNTPLSIHTIENQFDSNKMLQVTTEYTNNKLLLKKLFFYKNEKETQLRYDNDKDSISLFSVTETIYPLDPVKYKNEQKQEVFEKIINGRETHDIYKYNKYGLKERIDHYEGLEPSGHTQFDYEYY